MNNPNPNDCLVIETLSVYKFQQVLGTLQLAGKVALDQIAYVNEARSLKSLKIQGISRCNEGKIGDGAMNNPNPTDLRITNHQHIEISASSSLTSARKKG